VDLESDHIAWSIGETDASSIWEVTLQGSVDVSLELDLLDADGTILARVHADPRGHATLRDLRLTAGTYYLKPQGSVTAWVISAMRASGPGFDPEPNDTAERATPLPAGVVLTGRLSDSVDLYRLTIGAALASRLLEIRLIAADGPERALCLYTVLTGGAGERLACTRDSGGATLANLALPEGEYLVEVSGQPDISHGYHLRVDTTSEVRDGFEREPNDTPATAMRFDTGIPFRGRLHPSDIDWFRLHVSGEPQLWEVTAQGTELAYLDAYRAGDTRLASGQVSDDASSVTLTDLYLIPGDHWFRLGGTTGEYQLRATPLGPPDPARSEPTGPAGSHTPSTTTHTSLRSGPSITSG
jgi:hypothetical protein